MIVEIVQCLDHSFLGSRFDDFHLSRPTFDSLIKYRKYQDGVIPAKARYEVAL